VQFENAATVGEMAVNMTAEKLEETIES